MPGSSPEALARRVVRLEARVRRLRALLSLAFAVIRVTKPDLTHARISAGNKRCLLKAIDRARDIVGLGRVLADLGISASRLSSWRARARGCDLIDQPSCPSTKPGRITPAEIAAMREMATSPEYRHVPTGRLAMLAQRMGKVFVSATTWYRLTRERGWRRPRSRIHPGKPEDGIRATAPDQLWHVDMTVIRLVDWSKVNLHAIFDNYSRRILSWRLLPHFDPGVTADLIIEAGQHLPRGTQRPTLLTDGGVENFNGAVDALVNKGALRRVLAQIDISYSNSLIEAWWRQLKDQWLFMNKLNTIRSVH